MDIPRDFWVKHVSSQNVSFQIPYLISFFLGKFQHLTVFDFNWTNIYWKWYLMIFGRFSSEKSFSNCKTFITNNFFCWQLFSGQWTFYINKYASKSAISNNLWKWASDIFLSVKCLLITFGSCMLFVAVFWVAFPLLVEISSSCLIVSNVNRLDMNDNSERQSTRMAHWHWSS